jgi:branched-chain amino acid transport system substrate-binding protein
LPRIIGFSGTAQKSASSYQDLDYKDFQGTERRWPTDESNLLHVRLRTSLLAQAKQRRMKSMKRTLFLLAVVLMASMLAGCGCGATDEGPIKIGATLPLTGGFAINGQKHKDGYEMCVKLINDKGGLLGRQVELIVSDNQSDVDTSLAQIERFLNVDKIDLMFGSFSSKLTFPLSSVTEQNKIVHPIPSGAALKIYERGYEYVFYFQPQAAEHVGMTPIGMLQDLVDAGDMPKTAALVHADDFYADAISAGLMGIDFEVDGTDRVVTLAPGLLAEAGMEMVYEEKWPEEGFSDWIGLANSIKASGAEMVFGLTASPDEAIQLVRAMQTVEYQPKAVYLSQGTQEEFVEAVGDAANGIMIHSAWDPAVQWEGLLAGEKFTNQDFQEAFEAEYGRAPDEDEVIPFALCQGMEQAVRAVGSTDNVKMQEWLASRTESDPVKTILGDFYWDDRGLPVGKPYLMTQWQDGELKFVYPVGDFPGTTDLVYPKPEW